MSLTAEVVVYETGRPLEEERFRAYVRVGQKDEEDYAILAGCFGATEVIARQSVLWKLKQVIQAASELTKREK